MVSTKFLRRPYFATGGSFPRFSLLDAEARKLPTRNENARLKGDLANYNRRAYLLRPFLASLRGRGEREERANSKEEHFLPREEKEERAPRSEVFGESYSKPGLVGGVDEEEDSSRERTECLRKVVSERDSSLIERLRKSKGVKLRKSSLENESHLREGSFGSEGPSAMPFQKRRRRTRERRPTRERRRRRREFGMEVGVVFFLVDFWLVETRGRGATLKVSINRRRGAKGSIEEDPLREWMLTTLT